jgi:hypothetical protein
MKRRGVTPFVTLWNRFGPQFGKIPQHGLPEQGGMQGGYAIDGMAADGREVRHAQQLVAALVDQRHPRHTRLVIGVALTEIVEKPAVDLIDDFERAWQQAPEERQTPGLERFRQERVVRIGQCAPGDVPSLVPRHLPLVDQEPHQLGDRDRRMGIVQLRREHVREPLRRFALEVEQAQHVLQRA